MNEDNAFQRSNDLLDTGAEAYRNGDYLTAQKYYTQAAKLGNSQAMCNLGYIYEYGRTGQRDYKKAFYCFKMAADKDNAEACYKVGDITGMHLRKTTIWPHILSKSCGNCR